jgi:hypothetical protein
MNRLAKVVGLLLIAVLLVIVVVPDLDLPPTAKFSSARQRVPLAAFNAIIPAGVALLSPKFLRSPVRVERPSFSYVSTSLIDRNCTRRC